MNFVIKNTNFAEYTESIEMKYIYFKVIFFLLISTTFSFGSDISKHILFLHSYNIDYEWTYSIDSAARRILGNSPAISITTDFLDARNIDYKHNYIVIKKRLLEKYQNKKFDVVLISDDEALDFFLLNRSYIFSNVPAVFCGINKFVPEDFLDHDKITGIIESISMNDTFSLIQSIHKNSKIFILGDQRYASYKLNKYIIEKKLSNTTNKKFDIEFISNKDINEVIDFLNKNKTIPLILISPLYTAYGNEIPKKLTLNILTLKTKNPIYTFWDTDVKYGAIGGKVVSGKKQGEFAANYVLDILSNKPFEELPVISSENSNIFMFNNISLIEHKIPYDKIPPKSEILFRSDKQFIKIKKQHLLFISTIILILFLITFLLFKKMNNENKISKT